MIERPEFWLWARLRLDIENQSLLLQSRLITLVTTIREDVVARLGSHWSSSFITALSLVESFIVMLRQLSYAKKNHLNAPKDSYLGHFLHFAGFL